MTAQYLRVLPHSSLGATPVPMPDGSKLHRHNAPAEGHLVMDSLFVRRRIMFGELELLAEGPEALSTGDSA
jgi:hypothetical protein